MSNHIVQLQLDVCYKACKECLLHMGCQTHCDIELLAKYCMRDELFI